MVRSGWNEIVALGSSLQRAGLIEHDFRRESAATSRPVGGRLNAARRCSNHGLFSSPSHLSTSILSGDHGSPNSDCRLLDEFLGKLPGLGGICQDPPPSFSTESGLTGSSWAVRGSAPSAHPSSAQNVPMPWFPRWRLLHRRLPQNDAQLRQKPARLMPNIALPNRRDSIHLAVSSELFESTANKRFC